MAKRKKKQADVSDDIKLDETFPVDFYNARFQTIDGIEYMRRLERPIWPGSFTQERKDWIKARQGEFKRLVNEAMAGEPASDDDLALINRYLYQHELTIARSTDGKRWSLIDIADIAGSDPWLHRMEFLYRWLVHLFNKRIQVRHCFCGNIFYRKNWGSREKLYCSKRCKNRMAQRRRRAMSKPQSVKRG